MASNILQLPIEIRSFWWCYWWVITIEWYARSLFQFKYFLCFYQRPIYQHIFQINVNSLTVSIQYIDTYTYSVLNRQYFFFVSGSTLWDIKYITIKWNLFSYKPNDTRCNFAPQTWAKHKQNTPQRLVLYTCTLSTSEFRQVMDL